MMNLALDAALMLAAAAVPAWVAGKAVRRLLRSRSRNMLLYALVLAVALAVLAGMAGYGPLAGVSERGLTLAGLGTLPLWFAVRELARRAKLLGAPDPGDPVFTSVREGRSGPSRSPASG